jgi:predicted metal-dependent HD superfamily phosphohydrolase
MLLAMGDRLPLDLLSRWNALAARVGLDDPGDGDGRELLLRWQEPHRRYHNEHHLVAVLAHLDILEGEADDPDAVRLAGWFHDAIYEPGATDNEVASAALATAVLTEGGVDPARAHEVARLVRLTARHDAGADDRNGRALCDADLAVLGSEATEYARYAAGIREEYAHIDDDTFRTGRIGVLNRLLEKRPLYATVRYRDDREDTARRNMQMELALLTSGAADSVAVPPT